MSVDAGKLAAEVEKQGEEVRRIKATPGTPGLEAAVEKLKALKKQLEEQQQQPKREPTPEEKRREAFDQLLIRKMFVVPAFEIYGGVAGLYDYGPPGSGLMSNIQAVWRRHFVLEESMLEVSCTSMTPEPVLVTSGHVAKFEDFMVKDEKTGESLRADHLLEGFIDRLVAAPGTTEAQRSELLAVRAKADAYSLEELTAVLRRLKVTSPAGNPVTDPYPFNLMFKTSIGPSGKLVGYLRPETAQGIFVNFNRLLDYNAGRLPFAAAQIGAAFRNEIAPRAGLLRVREFALAEIEHFVNPNDKDHPRFREVEAMTLNLLPRALQDGTERVNLVAVGEAVRAGTIANQTLAYFMARTALFLVSIGVDPARLRFRQHLADEMAHYAEDCWDAEIRTLYGWVECVGHADRSCYDLSAHAKATERNLTARVNYDPPRLVRRCQLTVDSKAMGKTLRKDQEAARAELERLAREDPKSLIELSDRLKTGPQELRSCDRTFQLLPGMFSAQMGEERITGETFHPTVIEPSYGLGRILYCVLEHAFSTELRGAEERHVLRLKPLVAPFKVAVLPLAGGPEMDAMASEISARCLRLDLATRVDSTKGSIGRKYARTEELGVPFAVTVDFDALKTRRVTLRDRDTTTQVYASVEEVAQLVNDLVKGVTTWERVWSTHEQVKRVLDEDAE